MAGPGQVLKAIARAFCTLSMALLAVAGTVLGNRAAAGNGEESAPREEPVTATPAPEEEGSWTPERLKEAKPIEMPYAPGAPPTAQEPGDGEPGPSQSGAGSPGNGEVAPEEGTRLIPGLADPETGSDSTQ